MTVKAILHRLRLDRRGATAIEYGLIAALIVVAAMGGFRAMSGGSGGMWDKVKTKVETSITGGGG